MKYKFAIVFLITFFIPNAVLATPISLYETEITIDTNTLKYNIFITFDQKTDQLEIPLFFEIEDFTHKANFGDYNCNVYKEQWGSKILCNLGNVSKTGSLALNFDTKNTFLKKIDSSYLFEFSSKAPLSATTSRLKIKLDEGFVLSENNLSSFSPEDGKEGSDGRRIYVLWERENIKKGDGITGYITFESLSTPNKSGQDLTLFYVLFGVIIVLIACLFFYRTKSSGISSAINILRDDEKGDFSKATLSRLIKNLEERGLIKTERLGRSNRIYLNKNIDKKEEKSSSQEQSNSEIANTASIVQ